MIAERSTSFLYRSSCPDSRPSYRPRHTIALIISHARFYLVFYWCFTCSLRSLHVTTGSSPTSILNKQTSLLVTVNEFYARLASDRINKASESNYCTSANLQNLLQSPTKKISPNYRRHHPSIIDVVIGACASDFSVFDTTSFWAMASKNRSTTAFPCLRFDSEMCSFGRA